MRPILVSRIDHNDLYVVLCIFHIGGLLVQKSEVEMGDVIGKGSFGIVNKGKRKGKVVALKRIRLPGGYSGEETADTKEITVLR